jgi:hypothetical protein
MKRSADDILKMPDHQRKRLRLQKRFRHYKKENRPHFSKEDLLQYLRERKIRSCIVLEKTRKSNEPNTNDFRKEFGSWSEAVRLAFGTVIAADVDGDYLLKAVWELDLWSVAKFRAARKIDPVVVPSWRQIINKWGSYTNLFEAARRHHLKMQLEEYRRLIRKLGHIPNMDEIRRADLRMDDAIQFYGSKQEMDDFVQTLKG